MIHISMYIYILSIRIIFLTWPPPEPLGLLDDRTSISNLWPSNHGEKDGHMMFKRASLWPLSPH